MKRITLTIFFVVLAFGAIAQEVRSPEKLIELYKAALSKKDLRSFMTLAAPTGEKKRAILENRFQHQTTQRLVSMTIVPFATFEAQYKESLARGLKPNVEPKGWLLVEFATQSLPGGATSKMTEVLLVGTRNGSFYINSE